MKNNFRYFIRLDRFGVPIAGTLQRFSEKPKVGIWKEISVAPCGCYNEGDCFPSPEITFNCMSSGYINLITDVTDFAVDSYADVDFKNYKMPFARQSFLRLEASSSGIGGKFYINNELVHTFATSSEKFIINNFSTCDVYQMGYTTDEPIPHTATSGTYTTSTLPVFVRFGTIETTLFDNVNGITINQIYDWLVANNIYGGIFTILPDNSITWSGAIPPCEDLPNLQITITIR